ncbi:MAG: hypothetical protein ABSF60_13705 [Verrucomicrobiota bacterium]|jgi:hypothetical protein
MMRLGQIGKLQAIFERMDEFSKPRSKPLWWYVYWLGIAAVSSVMFMAKEITLLQRFLMVSLFVALAGAWFALLYFSQFAKRGPIPQWRLYFWIFVAAFGVYWLGSDHSWRIALFAALFCGIILGGFFFVLNWVATDRGREWIRQHPRFVRNVITSVLCFGIFCKLLGNIYGKKH